MALRQARLYEESAAALHAAITLDSQHFQAHGNLGFVLQTLGKHAAATEIFRAAIKIKPESADAHSNLGHTLLREGRVAEAIAHYEFAVAAKPASAPLHSNLLLALHYQSNLDAAWLFDQHLAWSRRHAPPLPVETPRHSNSPNPSRRLKVGYVSADLRDHPVGRFLLPLLQQHDRQAFSVYCYSGTTERDTLTSELQRHATAWHETTGVDDDALASLIRGHGIDVLVDLSGHTGGNRLPVFARKPAPIQATWLGYPNTTGLATIDYRITDVHADPPQHPPPHSTEQLVHLSETAWCYPVTAAPDVVPPPILTTGTPTFGCCNNLAKINDRVIRVWARILHELPQSRLLLKELAFGDPSVRTRYHALFADHGISPTRVTLLGRDADYPTHLARFGAIDVALDTFPYHGTTSTCEALWMGVPVVTLAGKTHVSRVGVSLLTNTGLADLVATTEEDYVRIATTLAGDPPRLQDLRRQLRERMRASPLMDAEKFSRAMEAAYRGMWTDWCARRT